MLDEKIGMMDEFPFLMSRCPKILVYQAWRIADWVREWGEGINHMQSKLYKYLCKFSVYMSKHVG